MVESIYKRNFRDTTLGLGLLLLGSLYFLFYKIDERFALHQATQFRIQILGLNGQNPAFRRL